MNARNDRHATPRLPLAPPLALLTLLAVTGCGGVAQPEVGQAAPAFPAAAVARRGAVRIERVENRTGRAECDDLAHYVHLKTAQALESAGWTVLSDDLLARADFLPLGRAADEAAASGAHHVRVEILRAEEKAGATVALAIYSTQQQHAAVAVRVHWRDADTGAERSGDGSGASVKGAWGVLAKVNREALTRREGFWQFDRSLLGTAAADALARALTSFP